MKVSDIYAWEQPDGTVHYFVTETTPGSTVVGSGGAVTSVAGRGGDVVLSNTDISGLGTASTHPATDFVAAGADATAGGTVQKVQGLAFDGTAPAADGKLWIWDNSLLKWVAQAISGDATLSKTGALTIGTNKVTNAQRAQMAANTLKGNNTAGTANEADLTVAQVKTLLAIATGDVSGLGTAATHATGDFAQTANNLSDLANLVTALNTLLPSQTGNNGKVLGTNGSTVSWVTGGGGGLSLTPTTLKTANYTAAASDFVSGDLGTTGSFTVTLPNAPADKTVVAVLVAVASGTRTLTVATGGTDKFDVAGGVTTKTLRNVGETWFGQYNAATGVWLTLAEPSLAQLTVQNNGSTIGARGTVDFDPTATFGWTVTDDGTAVHISGNVVKFGGLTLISHSYSQQDGNSGVIAGSMDNYAHHMAAALNIPPDEVRFRGRSGAQATSPSIGDSDQLGVGAVMRHLVPPHWYKMFSNPQWSDEAEPTLNVIFLGINDPVRDWTVASTIGKNCYTHAIRCMTAFRRLRSLYASDDASIVYTGTWSNSANNQSVKGILHDTATSGDSFTITLPKTLPVDANGNCTVDVFLFGQPNGSALNYSTSTNTHCDWSGTVAAATGNTIVGGQGTGGTGIQVVKRFACTAADAGKTIIGTMSNQLHSDHLQVIGWGIEDTAPPVVVLGKQPEGGFAGTGSFWTGSNVTDYNGVLDTIKAEFDAAVVVADTYTPYRNLFSAGLHTSLSADATLNHTGQTVVITPVSVSKCVINTGHVIRFGVGTCEEALVTAIDKTNGGANDGNWLLTCTRNYNGTDAGNASAITSNVAHTAGSELVSDCLPWAPDRVHPSPTGHRRLAAYLLDALGTVAQSDIQVAGAGGYGHSPWPTLPDNAYLWTFGGTRSTLATSIGANAGGVLSATRVFVPEDVIATELSVEINGTPSLMTYNIGIYADDNGMPGELLVDPGVSAAVSTTGIKTTAIFKPLHRGWYWLCYLPHLNAGNLGTIRAIQALSTPFLFAQTTNPLGSAFVDPTGVTLTGQTATTLPNPFPTPTNQAATILPCIVLKVSTWIKD